MDSKAWLVRTKDRLKRAKASHERTQVPGEVEQCSLCERVRRADGRWRRLTAEDVLDGSAWYSPSICTDCSGRLPRTVV